MSVPLKNQIIRYVLYKLNGRTSIIIQTSEIATALKASTRSVGITLAAHQFGEFSAEPVCTKSGQSQGIWKITRTDGNEETDSKRGKA